MLEKAASMPKVFKLKEVIKMYGIDVFPLFFLFVLGATYVMLLFYFGIVIVGRTCRECGKTLQSDDAYEQHMEEHKAEVATPPVYEQTKESRYAA